MDGVRDCIPFANAGLLVNYDTIPWMSFEHQNLTAKNMIQIQIRTHYSVSRTNC